MASDATFVNNALLLHCDGVNDSTTFTDNSPTPKTVTAVGAAKVSTAKSKFGGASAYLNGTDAYLSVVSHADFDFGTGDFTIECFVEPTSLSSYGIIVCRQEPGSGLALELRRNGAGLEAVLRGSDGSGLITVSGGTLVTGSMQHVAVARQGTTLRLFLDGALMASGTTSVNLDSPSGRPLTIGVLNDGAVAFYFAGYIDEVRVKKGVAIYTGAFTVPAYAYPNGAGEVKGVIHDDAGNPAARTVRIHRRDTGALIGSTVSDATTGAYSVNTTTLDEVQRVVLDDTAGTLYNDIIDRVIPS